ncbi:hypothetical protein [Haloferula sp. A504]|uniref:hypothetical protein n=1 Tax=Haloferula sp. A504 TaxID=3373601 RepID=UPI0031C8DC61|nr:hypothetical protein [Verrucomicrobiaceae bacterium E54]
MNPESLEDLQFRILALLDGTLDESGVTRLDAELRECRDARELYRNLALLHIALQEEAAGRSGIEHVPVIPIERLLARQRRRMVKGSLLAAAAVLLISGLVLWVTMVPRAPAPVADFQVGPDSSFTLSHTGEDVEAKGRVLQVGSQLDLDHGTLEATFESGIRCVIEAPAHLEVLAENHVRLREGSLWSEVPPAGVGFTVQTARFSVVDLGTEFGVVAPAKGSHEIHAIKGSVAVTMAGSGDDGTRTVLRAGEAHKVAAGGGLDKIPVRRGDFVTRLPQRIFVVNPSFEMDRNPDPGGDFRKGDRGDLGGQLTGWIAQSGKPTQVHVGWGGLDESELHPYPPAKGRNSQTLSLMSGASVLNVTGTPWSSLEVGDKLTLTIALGLRELRWNDQTFFGLTDGDFSPRGVPTMEDTVANSGRIAVNPATGDLSGNGSFRDVSFVHTVREADLQRPGKIGILLVGLGSSRDGEKQHGFFDNVRLHREASPGASQERR